MYFARLLRAAGLAVGPGKVLDAVTAVRIIGLGSRKDFYWCLFSQFVNRYDQRELFDQAFHIFWRNPHIMEKMIGAMLPTIRVEKDNEFDQLSRRLADALGDSGVDAREEPESEQIQFDASFTFSSREVLQDIDFEAMTAAEVAEAKRAIAKLRLPIMDVPTRRFQRDERGVRVDMRSSLRAALRSGDSIPLKFKKPRRRHPPLVMLCDISGSMSRYSRMFLHFMHAITNDRDRVHAFVFATRLTNITRHLRHRDIDLALDNVADAVGDWSGGTRIGACLKEFNNIWSRRVLGQGAITLILSDGLDREAAEGLAWQMERLAKSTRRLIWINPLLRYEGFEPKAAGIRAMLPYVDDFRSSHNLKSLAELTDVLSHVQPRGSQPMGSGLAC